MRAETSTNTMDTTAGRALKRRGILAAAGAVVAGIVAKHAAQPAAAGSDGDVIAAQTMPTYAATVVSGREPGSFPIVPYGFGGDAVFVGDATMLPDINLGTHQPYSVAGVKGIGKGTGPGIVGLGGGDTSSNTTGYPIGVRGSITDNGYGVYGKAGSGYGVYGTASGVGVGGAAFVGVQGLGGGDTSSNTTGFPIGVRGSVPDTGYGVYGQTGVGTGVYGQSTGGYGVYGVGGSNGVIGQSAGGNGVYGLASAAGTSQIVAGVFGDSSASYGIIGRTTAAGYSGLTAITSTPGVAALAATATVDTAYAAYFQGNTVVQGNFAVVGGNKSAAVKDAAGQHRLVYCMESPEAWFEDFGDAKLIAGKADVKLDPVFTQIAHTDTYHVFLTPYSGLGTLRVGARRADGFAVEEIGGTSSGSFSYRVVAKRQDIKGERLAKFDLPKIKVPDESKLPKPSPPKAAPSPLPVMKP